MPTLSTFKANPFRADNGELPNALLVMDRPVGAAIDELTARLKEEGKYDQFMAHAAKLYEDEATRVVDFMLANMPQGLTDRIAGVLLMRKASLFVVPQKPES